MCTGIELLNVSKNMKDNKYKSFLTVYRAHNEKIVLIGFLAF